MPDIQPDNNHNLFNVTIARLEERIATLISNQQHYIRREEFEPVKKIVYGVVSIVILTFITAVLALFLKR